MFHIPLFNIKKIYSYHINIIKYYFIYLEVTNSIDSGSYILDKYPHTYEAKADRGDNQFSTILSHYFQFLHTIHEEGFNKLTPSLKKLIITDIL